MRTFIPITTRIFVVIVLSVVLAASVNAAQSFTSATTIAIPANGIANPYPSAIAVTGVTAPVTKVSVTLADVSHAFPSDLDVLLVGPSGQSVILLSDTGSGLDINLVSLTFDDQARSPLARFAQIRPGRYQPINYGTTDGFPSPAPIGPRATTLSAFNGLDPNGTWSLYVVDDAYADGGSIGSWSLTISTGQAPSFEPLGAPTVAEASSLDVPLVVSDSDGDTVTFVDEGIPPFASVIADGTGGWLLRLAPGFDDAGSYLAVPFTFTDGEFLTRQLVTIDVSNTNRLPTLSTIGERSVVAGRRLDIPLTATDADGAIPVLTAGNLPPYATFTDNLDGTGTIALAPASTDAGDWPGVVVTADDGEAIATETFTLTVIANQPPVAPLVGDLLVAEGDTRQIGISATDADGDPLTLAATNLPAFATLTDQSAGTWMMVLAPGLDDEGSYPGVALTFSDGGYLVTETLAITVSHTNQPPTVATIADQTVREGDSIAVAISASDADSDPLTLSMTDNPAFATLTDHGAGSATLTLAPLAGDAAGGTYPPLSLTANDGIVSASVSVTVTVIPNQAPALDPIADVTMDDATSTTVTVQALDPDGDSLTLSALGLPAFASLLDNGDGSGTITLAPGPADHGTFPNLEIRVSDGVATVSQTFGVLVNDVNQPPTPLAGDDATVLDPDGTGDEVVTLDGLLSTDADGTIATAEWRAGTTVIASSLTTSVTLGIGSYAFDLYITDDDGATASDTITVVVTDSTAPVTLATPSIPIAAGGWYKASVTLSLSASDHIGGSGVREITYSATGATTIASTTIAGSSTSILFGRPGETLLSVSARDEAGNVEATQNISIRIDKLNPSATVPLHELITGSLVGSSNVPLRIAWASSDDRSGVYRVSVGIERNGVFSQFPATPVAIGERNVWANLGQSMRVRARASDYAGRISAWSTSAPFTTSLHDDTSPDIALTGGTWSTTINSRYAGGSTAFASEVGSTATFTFSGTSIGLVSATGPHRGRAEIRIDGILIETIDLRATTLVTKQLVFTANNLDPSTTHTISVTAIGSGRIDVDGFVVIN